jgi:hypothetical protein
MEDLFSKRAHNNVIHQNSSSIQVILCVNIIPHQNTVQIFKNVLAAYESAPLDRLGYRHKICNNTTIDDS